MLYGPSILPDSLNPRVNYPLDENYIAFIEDAFTPAIEMSSVAHNALTLALLILNDVDVSKFNDTMIYAAIKTVYLYGDAEDNRIMAYLSPTHQVMLYEEFYSKSTVAEMIASGEITILQTQQPEPARPDYYQGVDTFDTDLRTSED